jgi:hypothetical protein
MAIQATLEGGHDGELLRTGADVRPLPPLSNSHSANDSSPTNAGTNTKTVKIVS